MMSVKKICAVTALLCPALCAVDSGVDSTCSQGRPGLADATNLLQVKQDVNFGADRSKEPVTLVQTGKSHDGHLFRPAVEPVQEEGKYCRKSSLRINQYSFYCAFHLSDEDGMGTDGVTAHANAEKLHIQGVLSLKGKCTLLVTHAVQLFEKDLLAMGVTRLGKMTVDFAPDKANTGCSCYTHAFQDLGFRKLTFDESGQDEAAKNMQHSSRRKTNGFPLDCFSFPLGNAESSGLRTKWTFTDRMDADVKSTLHITPRELRSGREKILDHAQFVVGGEPSEDPGQIPRPRDTSGVVTTS